MSQTVADFFWDRLHAWGVRRIFGYPGDGINGLLGALDRQGDRFEFVQVRHEEMAAFMASAHAKFTGELGVCLATSGPGASHLVTGLYDARMDHMPVLAIVGQQARAVLGAHYQQELDLVSMFKDVAGDYVQMATAPAQVRHLTDRAVRIARARSRVTALILPNDLQELPMEQPVRAHGNTFSGVGWSRPVTIPAAPDLQQAAEILNAGEKVALVVGAGAKGATDEIIELADRLHAGAAKALLGKEVLPDDLRWVTGQMGLLGTKPSYDLMAECDTLLMIGSGFPYSEFLPKEGAARGVQIDIDPGMLSLRYPMECNLQGDAKATIAALLPLLRQKIDGGWRAKIAGWNDAWNTTVEARAKAAADPINPQRLFTELSPRLPERVIVTSDSGSCANWYARDLKMRRGMMGSLSGGLASMGAAVPYAIAAKFAHPDRPVIACVGDGAMQMNNMAELITIAKYMDRWVNRTLIVAVLNNEDLNQVTWEQRVMGGDPKFEATQNIPDVPYHRFAEMIGLEGIYCDSPEQVGPVWDRALAADRPVVINFKTDPAVAPLPPHITLTQAKNFMTALTVDPDARSVIRDTARQVMAKILPGE